MSELRPTWLGRRPYGEVLQAMRTRRQQIIAGEAEEVFWLVEHDPVITTGRRAAAGVPHAAWLAERGTRLVETERGGLATWHGPGQLVGYPLVRLPERGLGVRAYVEALQDGVTAWLARHDVHAHRREGAPGVWVGGDKICAVGVHISRGVSMHGFALNLCPDLTPFSWFVPCGIEDAGVTSLEVLTSRQVQCVDVAEEIAGCVLAAMNERARSR